MAYVQKPDTCNPYRGWVMLYRIGGVYCTKDNVRYVKVGPERLRYDDAARLFHQVVDQEEK